MIELLYFIIIYINRLVLKNIIRLVMG